MNRFKVQEIVRKPDFYEKLVILLSKINASRKKGILGKKGHLDDTFSVYKVWIYGGSVMDRSIKLKK